MRLTGFVAVQLACVSFLAANVGATIVVNDGYTGPAHVMFLTSTTFDGDLGGIAGADAKVTAVGNAGSETSGMGLTWKAVISDLTQNASSIIPATDLAPVYNTNGDRVANKYADLFAGPTLKAVSFDQNGTDWFTVEFDVVWTGSNPAGIVSTNHCQNWSTDLNTQRGDYGDYHGGLGSTHISSGFDWDCASTSLGIHLYGISTNTTTAVPEPSSFVVLGLFAAGVAVYRRKRVVVLLEQLCQLRR